VLFNNFDELIQKNIIDKKIKNNKKLFTSPSLKG
jgi:hypothetical protein